MSSTKLSEKPKLTQLKPFGVLVEPANEKTSVHDLDTEFLRDLFRKNQIVVLRGFQTFQNADGFSDYCERWGEVSLWPFGKVLELIEQENPEDHIFDNSYMPLHWDGMYRPQVPEYQIFHCVKAPLAGQGGATTFSNTILALQSAPAETKELWTKVTGTYKRKMEFYNSKTVSPIITKHPYRDVSVIRYSEPHFEHKGDFVNPPDVEFSGIEQKQLNEFHQSLGKALYSQDCFYAHEWQTGDVVIADNFSLLHGRAEFVSRSPRHIQRVHVLSNPPFDNPHLESYE
jgi:alpha-ketoglutarate-dependent taurine dioxygenase